MKLLKKDFNNLIRNIQGIIVYLIVINNLSFINNKIIHLQEN